MSYQTSIHFNPTALLTIKTEVDNSIKQVETAVAALVEEQQLPFGIDDALLQLQQCSKILYLIDQPKLGQVTQYCAELMQKIMQEPDNTDNIKSLSEGTAVVKRYIEFSCLKEVIIPQFLLESLNRLEYSLGKPLTREGHQIRPFLECVSPKFDLSEIQTLETSTYVHQLYKLCLKQLLEQNKVNENAFYVVGAQLASVALSTPHAQYWALVCRVLQQLKDTLITPTRLRVLIHLETQIGKFFTNQNEFQTSVDDLADILSLCVSQENVLAEQIRERLNLGDDILSDTQLQIFRSQLFAPDHETVKAVATLLSEDITTLHKEIEYNYATLSTERTIEIKKLLDRIAQVLMLINLTNTARPLLEASQSSNSFTDEQYTQSIINDLSVALNDLGLYVRQNTSSYLQYPVNNKAIALDRLDNAYETLITEFKALVELSSSTLISYTETQDLNALESLPSQFREMSGAIYFFINNEKAQKAFLACSYFLEQQIENQHPLSTEDIQNILNVCASADILIDAVLNQQPIMFSMFDVAFTSSQQLKHAA